MVKSRDDVPIRQQILEKGIVATMEDRNKSYGDPHIQLELSGAIKDLCRMFHANHSPRLISHAEWDSLDNVIQKLSRVVVGPEPGEDSYVDGAVYFAIAGECAARAKGQP